MNTLEQQIEEILKEYADIQFATSYYDPRRKVLEKLTNLITEILDSCPLKEIRYSEDEFYGMKVAVSEHTLADGGFKLTTSKEIDAHNKAVAEFEKWKKEVFGE